MFKILFRLFAAKQILRVMHSQDLKRIHPLTDWSHDCSKCKQPVGIFPSGQRIIDMYGKRKVEIICNRCEPPRNWPVMIAYGAELEQKETFLWRETDEPPH